MSNSLNACENDQQQIPEHSQPDASCAGELGNAQCDQNKDGQPSSQHPWRWTAHTADQLVDGTITPTNNFCKRCQNIFDILTRILLCWDEIPPMWAAARYATGSSRTSRLPGLGQFLINFGGICLTMTTDCGFCTFFAQIFRSTLQGEGIPQRKEVVVLLNTNNISKVEPQPDADDAHKGTTRWRKALGFGIFDAKCAAMLPPPGTAFLRDELERISLDDYFLVSVEPTVRLIDTDDVTTQHVNSHRTDSTESHVSIGLPRLRPAFADPSRFVKWLQGCEQLHRKKCTKYRRQFKHSIRLVDTSRLRIETFDPDSVPSYFTLSYVWGTKKYLRLEEANLGQATSQGFSPGANFHPSVSDTIALMNGMKETYLWVDSLCIVQNSDSDKRAQIDQMDAVYANSDLTIVAAGDDQGRLAGVTQPRAEIDSIRAGSLVFVSDPCSYSESHWFDNVAWSTRAWTLQEYILSHRKLIFTGDQVYWWCQCASWRESVHLASLTHRYQALREIHNAPMSNVHKHSIKALAARSRRDYADSFGEIIEEYSGRQLTVQADRLSAISGILNAIHNLNPRRKYFWALTTCSFEIELDWFDLNPSESKGEFVPIAGSMFPSWSWLSFPGPVGSVSGDRCVACFRLFYEPSSANFDCKRISDSKFIVPPGTSDSSHIPWQVSAKHIQSNFVGITLNPDRQIIFWVDVVKLGVRWNQKLDHATGRLLTGFDEGLLVTELEEDQKCCLWAWSVEIDKTQTEYDFISINQDLSAVSRCRSIWILKWRNGVAIRAGHGVILQKVWKSLTIDRRIIVME
jgi:hypothetical protein